MAGLLALGIETATRAGGVALVDEDGVVVSLHVNLEQSHSRQTAGLIQQALQAAGVTAADVSIVGVSIGPGSFTGARIGLSLAKGLCLAAGVPLTGVSTLEGLAARAGVPGALVSPLLDARRAEAYAALFRLAADPDETPQRLHPDDRMPLEAWLDRIETMAGGEPVWFTGDARRCFQASLRQRLGSRARLAGALRSEPAADTIAWLALRGRLTDPDVGRDWETLEPEYVRSGGSPSNL